MNKMIIALSAAAAIMAAACSQQSADKTTQNAPAAETVPAEVRTVIPAMADGTVHELDDPSVYTAQARPEGLMILDFNAVWCGPCRQLSPVFEEMAKKFEGKATFVSVDVDKYGYLMDTYDLGSSIPVVLILRPDGTRQRFVGTGDLLPAAKFEALIENNLK